MPLKVFALINVLRLSGMIMIPVLQGLGHPNKVLRYSGWCLALLPAAFMWGASHGIMGVMLAWSCAYPLVYLYLAGEALKELNISWGEFLKSSSTPLICVSIMASMLFLFDGFGVLEKYDWPRFILAIAIGAMSYGLAYVALFPRQLSEIISGLKQLRNIK